MKTDRTAVIAMVYGDSFIEKWIDHYSRQVGIEHLYVVSHGQNDFHRKVCSSANHLVVPRKFDKSFDLRRRSLLDHLSNGLLEAYDTVIVTDVDEFIVVNPDLNLSLAEYLLGRREAVLCPIGFNVVPVEVGRAIDWGARILDQAPLAFYSPAFCKPVLKKKPCQNGPGGHSLVGSGFFVDPNLVLFHLKFVDSRLAKRYDDLAVEVDKLYDDRSISNGIAQWRKDREKIGGFQAGRRLLSHSVMTPQENTAGATAVIKVDGKNRFRVAPGQRTDPFLLPGSYRKML
jgi:hypothetical protein